MPFHWPKYVAEELLTPLLLMFDRAVHSHGSSDFLLQREPFICKTNPHLVSYFLTLGIICQDFDFVQRFPVG